MTSATGVVSQQLRRSTTSLVEAEHLARLSHRRPPGIAVPEGGHEHTVEVDCSAYRGGAGSSEDQDRAHRQRATAAGQQQLHLPRAAAGLLDLLSQAIGVRQGLAPAQEGLDLDRLEPRGGEHDVVDVQLLERQAADHPVQAGGAAQLVADVTFDQTAQPCQQAAVGYGKEYGHEHAYRPQVGPTMAACTIGWL